MQTVEHLCKKLQSVNCYLDFSSLSKNSKILVQNIKTTLESVLQVATPRFATPQFAVPQLATLQFAAL